MLQEGTLDVKGIMTECCLVSPLLARLRPAGYDQGY